MKTNKFTQKARAPKRQSRMFLMRMLVVFLDLTVPASRKANPPCRKNTMQLLMRTKKVSKVSFISFSPSISGVDGVMGDWVEVDEMPVVRLARTVVVVEDMTSVMVVIIIRFVAMFSVLEKISVVPISTSGISVDIFSCSVENISVENISSRNSVTIPSVPAIFVNRGRDHNWQ